MVTKRIAAFSNNAYCSVLAKIFMVTKHEIMKVFGYTGSVLAKIFMVTKRKYQER